MLNLLGKYKSINHKLHQHYSEINNASLGQFINCLSSSFIWQICSVRVNPLAEVPYAFRVFAQMMTAWPSVIFSANLTRICSSCCWFLVRKCSEIILNSKRCQIVCTQFVRQWSITFQHLFSVKILIQCGVMPWSIKLTYR